jgi:anti-anti-sigma regulatory factor
MTTTIDFELAERVSVTGDNALVPFLRQNPDVPVRLSARRLRRLDTPLVQVLLAAAADRRRRGVGFALCDVSPAQVDLLASLGVTEAVLPMERAQ